ncbi:UNVERIFIED_CONTAM: Nucleolar protein 10 [Sesamum latifolium]|uniref:Nucleolar protein 10 n=1 Tax=Sesamum latifolium TaxID=2727402 RepID=A0AAW2XGL4_9LAMI
MFPICCGGEDGAVECFDMRTRSSVGRIDVVASAGDVDGEVTAIEFDGDGGYLMAVGSSGGKVLIYDLRSSNPLRVKDHMYGSPILNIKWHKTLNSEQSKLITADKHIVRIWDPETGEGMTSIEPAAGKINDMCVFKESGLILLALDSSQIPSYFIPALGPAPKWCSYLENLTEELEEGGQTTIYDDYKFLTKEDLAKLNLTNLIGTNLLRAYMHGFFIDYRLYKKAQSLADPFAYETYIERRSRRVGAACRSSTHSQDIFAGLQCFLHKPSDTSDSRLTVPLICHRSNRGTEADLVISFGKGNWLSRTLVLVMDRICLQDCVGMCGIDRQLVNPQGISIGLVHAE